MRRLRRRGSCGRALRARPRREPINAGFTTYQPEPTYGDGRRDLLRQITGALSAMALHDRTKRIVATASPDETVLDGGPAKCKVLDRLSFELLEHQLGGVAAVRQFAKSRGSGAASFLEAEWVATEAAFYYVLFNTGIHYRWPWNDIEHLAVTGSGLLGSTRTLQVRTDDEDFKLSVGKRAAESLTQLAKMHADK